MPGQPAVVELGDQPMLVGRVQQSGRMQPVDELTYAIKPAHVWQRNPDRSGGLPGPEASVSLLTAP